MMQLSSDGYEARDPMPMIGNNYPLEEYVLSYFGGHPWRQGQSYASTGYKGNATSFRGNNSGWQAKLLNVIIFKESGQILDEEQLAFLADPGIPDDQAAQTIIPNTAAFQTQDLMLMIMTVMRSLMQRQF
nr:hypothetical protein [Tanacetum cinerariifolium]